MVHPHIHYDACSWIPIAHLQHIVLFFLGCGLEMTCSHVALDLCLSRLAAIKIRNHSIHLKRDEQLLVRLFVDEYDVVWRISIILTGNVLNLVSIRT